MLHVDLVLQYSGALCCTWTSSCNIQGLYVARGPSLATFGGFILHVDLLLQHSGTLYCTWTFSCNIRYLIYTNKKAETNKNCLSLFHHIGISRLIQYFINTLCKIRFKKVVTMYTFRMCYKS